MNFGAAYYLLVFVKLRERERHRVDQGKKKKKMDGGWWMVDILSLMLYIKFGCHHHPPYFS